MAMRWGTAAGRGAGLVAAGSGMEAGRDVGQEAGGTVPGDTGGTDLSGDRAAGGRSGDQTLPHSPGLRRIAVSASAAVLVLVAVAVVRQMPGRSPAVMAAAAAALLVAATAVALLQVGQRTVDAQYLAALVLVGLAGAVLAGLFPNAPCYLVVYLALGGLGMRLPPVPAFIAGLAVFAAMSLAFLLAGKLTPSIQASQDIGAGFVFAVGVFARSVRISQEAARAAQARAEDLLARLRASRAAQAQAAALTERARVAREIHDILAHALSGLVLGLDTMELLGRQESTDGATMGAMLEQVARAQRMARDGLADTRRAIAALRGDELPGPALLDRLVRETAAATGIRAALSVSGEQRPLPPEIGLAVYRTAQEALINTAKYAGRGGCTELRLSYRDDCVELAAQDAGPGDAGPGPPGLTFGGYGLAGMRERAELLGGTLTAGPTDSGFRVLLRLPASQAPGRAGPG